MMKKILLLILTTLSFISYGQWTQLNSSTTNDLFDIDFSTDGTGLAVGTGGTILKTVDGGQTWTSLQGISDDLYAVAVVDANTYIVGGYDAWKTENGGNTWEALGFIYVKEISFTDNMNGYIVDGNGIYKTTDGGLNWSLENEPGGTTNLETFQTLDDQTQVSFGNIGGFVGYSAYAYRCNEQGEWFDFDVFSFPNAWAFSAAYFPDAETGFLFNNQYSGWVPGPVNNLVRMTNFQLVPDPAGFPVWVFDSEIINSAMPEYVNDAWFATSSEGYAAGEAGSILVTHDGGVNWEAEYSGTQAVRGFWFKNSSNAFAIGAGGLILKHYVVLPDEPLPPVNLGFTIYNSQVLLNWEVPTTSLEVLGYNVYRDNEKINLSLVTFNSFEDTDATTGTHFYYITALYDGTESEASNIIQVNIDGETGKIHGFIRNAISNLSIENALLYTTNTENGAQAITTLFGSYYSIKLPAGLYNLTCVADGYDPQTVLSLEVIEGANTGYTFYLNPSDQITGIQEDSGFSIQISPNPATDKVTISGNEVVNIQVYSITGVLLFSVQNNETTISLDRFCKGIYIVKFTKSTGKVTTKSLLVK